MVFNIRNITPEKVKKKYAKKTYANLRMKNLIMYRSCILYYGVVKYDTNI